MKIWMLLIGLTFIASPTTVLAQNDLSRAERNYRALNLGQKQLSDLSPVEREEVRQLARIVSGTPLPHLQTRSECLKANATSDQPSALESRTLDLKCSGLKD
jgi:hypothetical protein